MDIYEMKGAYESEDGDYLFFTDAETSDGEMLAEIAQDVDSIDELIQSIKDNSEVFTSDVYIYKANWTFIA